MLFAHKKKKGVLRVLICINQIGYYVINYAKKGNCFSLYNKIGIVVVNDDILNDEL